MAKTIKGNGVIDGTDASEIIKGGKGDDTITGGAGNDTITGGTGFNTIIHHRGDGNDVINLTKGENLELQVDGLADGADLYTTSVKYSANKKDVLVYTSENEYITLKNLGSKDVTNNSSKKKEDTSSVSLSVDCEKLDLRKDISIYTQTGKNFTGTWLNDNIDAGDTVLYKTVKVNGKKEVVEKDSADKGLKLDGGKGHDVINATKYSDTIIGGDGDDWITAGDGNDIINAGNGNDVIYGGLGNDTITGGAGENWIEYGVGEGHDVINLTKGENLSLEILTEEEGIIGYVKKSDIAWEYSANKKDLVIYADKNDKESGSITLKNFAAKDVTNNATKKTEDTSSVDLYVRSTDPDAKLYNSEKIDLRKITVSTITDKNFTGTWLNDEIDASGAYLTKTVKVNGVKEFVEKADTDKGLTLNGGAGNDTIIGTKYSDTIKGGDGNDVINGGTGNDNLNGGKGNDIITSGSGKNTIYGEAGNDIINVTEGENVVYGGKDNDVINTSLYSKNTYVFNNKDGHDVINISGDKLSSGDIQSDIIKLTGVKQNGFSVTTDGDDVVISYNADKKGVYQDSVRISDYLKSSADLKDITIVTKDKKQTSLNELLKGQFTEGRELSSSTAYETFYGSFANDTITSSGGNSSIYGGEGNDTITSSGGNSSIYGGKGDDVIYTQRYSHDNLIFANGDGNDIIYQLKDNMQKYTTTQADAIELTGVDKDGYTYAINGKDVVISYNADSESKYQDSITLKDYLKDEENSRDITIKTNDGEEASLNDMINASLQAGVEDTALVGTIGADTLSTSTANSVLYGFYGNDTITASGAFSTIYGGEGNDVITASGGTSVVYGGEGNDTITSGGAKSTIYGGKGDDVIKTNSYISDVLVFENGDGNDVIEETVKFSRNSEADTIMLTGVDKDGFTQKISGNDLVISYNKDENGIFQDSITIKDFLKNPDDIPNYKIVTKDGYESTANLEYLKEEVTSWLTIYCYDDVASDLEDNHENAIYELMNTFKTANNEQSYAGGLL